MTNIPFPPVKPPTYQPQAAVDAKLPTSGAAVYRANLAADLVLDIEVYRLPVEQLLYKAKRLADALDDDVAKNWIEWELAGLTMPLSTDARTHAESVGRVHKLTVQDQAGEVKETTRVILESLVQLETHTLPSHAEGTIEQKARLDHVKKMRTIPGARIPRVDDAAVEQLVRRGALEVLKMREIPRRVRAKLHDFAVRAYHHIVLSEVTASLFERHKLAVDRILLEAAPDVLDKIPSVYDRLAVAREDKEAISQAMSSCRRMISEFADAVMPPRSEPAVDETGTKHELRQTDVLNRIHQSLVEKCPSTSRRDRLVRTIRAVFDRVSAGMKTDITAEEAQSLFLMTYLTLGEIAEAITPEIK